MSNLTQQPAAICALKSPADAIFILEAVREGRVPRVTRRLTGHERAMITPGTVWVWEEEETNMRRWTDGRRWGASRVGGGGFLVYTESNESLSPPPSSNPYNPNYYQPPPNKAEGLIKQTYSTSMKTPSGKSKRFHVVAYSRKFNPQSEVQEPMPLPHELPALKGITIQPSNWPEWEQQRTTTEAYARRPPPGVTLSPIDTKTSPLAPATTATMDKTAGHTFPSRLPSPPEMPPNPSYANAQYLPRDPYDRRPQPYGQPQIYGNDRYPAYYDSRQPARPSYPGSDSSSSYPTIVTPSEPWYNSRRERSPPPRDSAASGYLQTPYQYYPRDRYAENSPSYMPYGQPVEYRSPDLRSYEPIDTKPNSALLQPSIGRLPLTPNSATSGTHELPGTGPSPKLSINNSLLNPTENSGLPAGPGLTLPPLRMTLDDTSINGRKSPNGEVLPSEDARQLDGLGRKAY